MYFALNASLTQTSISREGSLAQGHRARWLWTRLRRAFPSAVAACLVPDGVELVVEGDSSQQVRAQLRRVMAGYARALGGAGCWQPLGVPVAVPEGVAAKLAARQVSTAACQRGLCADPRQWLWSTHRDVCGAVVFPWVTAGAVARAIAWTADEVETGWHAYVTAVIPPVADWVDVAWCPAPVVAGTGEDLAAVLRAACTATRSAPVELRRSGPAASVAAALAAARGLHPTSGLSAALGLSARGVRRLAKRATEVELAAALRCLDHGPLRLALEG